MNATPEASRTADLWRHLIGCFGGDAMRRKYGDGVPPEWVGTVAKLTDSQLERGMRRLLASGAQSPPTLPHFARLCRELTSDHDEPAPVMARVASESHTPAQRFANLVLADWLMWHVRERCEAYVTPDVARAMYAAAQEVAATMHALWSERDPEADTQRFLDALCSQAIALCDPDEARAYREHVRGKQITP